MLRGGFVSVWVLWKGTAPLKGSWQSHLGHEDSGASKGRDATLGRGRTSHGHLWRRRVLASPRTESSFPRSLA